jgi:hypothetical protein
MQFSILSTLHMQIFNVMSLTNHKHMFRADVKWNIAVTCKPLAPFPPVGASADRQGNGPSRPAPALRQHKNLLAQRLSQEFLLFFFILTLASRARSWRRLRPMKFSALHSAAKLQRELVSANSLPQFLIYILI